MPRPPRRRPRSRRWHCLVLVAAAVAATACQVRIGTDVAITADGSGTIALTVALDEELASSLAADGFDPFAAVEELPDRWQVERADTDAGRAVTVTADFADPAGLTALVAQLHEGLDDEDPRLLADVEATVDADGSATFTGRAGFRPPSSTGLRGVGVRFDGDDLANLLAERGDEVMRVDLRVAMPGPIVETNADTIDGAVATWRLPVTGLTEVRAASDPPVDRTWWVIGGAALVGLIVGLIAVRSVRRRR